MSVDKLVDSSQLDTDLTSVANAIRTKGGTSAQLAFPAGFVSAIGAIPTSTTPTGTINIISNGTYDVTDKATAIVNVPGSTPTGTKQISISANGTTTEDVAAYANAEITVNVPSGGDYVANDWLVAGKPTGVLTDNGSGTRPGFMYALYNRTGITGLIFPNATKAQKNGVRDCLNIVSISAPNVTVLSESAYNKVGITTGVFPKVYEIGNYGIVSTSMTALDILGCNDNAYGLIQNYGLTGNTALAMIVIRATSGVMTLQHATNSLKDTPFKSGGTGGTLYVPESMISAYQSASNWSTVLGRSTNQIKSIESTHTDPDAPIDLTLYFADGTPIT